MHLFRSSETAIGQCYILAVHPPRFSRTLQATTSYQPSCRVQVLPSYQMMPAIRTSANTSTLPRAPHHPTTRSRPPSKTTPYRQFERISSQLIELPWIPIAKKIFALRYNRHANIPPNPREQPDTYAHKTVFSKSKPLVRLPSIKTAPRHSNSNLKALHAYSQRKKLYKSSQTELPIDTETLPASM